MYKKQIKEWLLTNEPGIYSIIVSQYSREMTDLKPRFLRKWLSDELDVPEEKINISSLNSAIGRFKKTQKKLQKGKETTTLETEVKLPQKGDYNFLESKNLLPPPTTIPK